MITKKERIQLRSLASTIKPTIWIGKDGFSESALKQIENELYDHELVKISLQENAEPITEYSLSEIAVKLGAEVVTTIGRKIVLYKHSEKKGIKHKLA